MGVRRRGYWVPHYVWQLRDELRKAGIERVNGKPLSRIRKKQLYAVFFGLRERQKRGIIMCSRLGEFMEALRRDPDVLESSAEAYCGDVRRFVAWFSKREGFEPDPATLTYIDVAEYRNSLGDNGRRGATINRALNAIQRWMRWAGNEDANNVRHIKLNRRGAPNGLTRTEFRAVLRAAKRRRHPERNTAIVQLMAQAGLRVSEVAGLSKGALQLNGRSGSVTVVGKRLKERTVPLNLAVRKALQAWLEVRGDGPPTEPVFLSQKGTRLRLSQRSIQEAVRNLMLDAGVEGSAHSLRHLFAHEYLRGSSNDLVGLARLLGHSNLNTTMIYTEPSSHDLATRMERMAIAG